MVKLVGILDDGDRGGPKACLARRQIPLEIEPDLTMVSCQQTFAKLSQ